MYRVVLVDDERFVLASLEGRIDWEKHGFAIAGKAMDAIEGMALIRSEHPDMQRRFCPARAVWRLRQRR